MDELTEGRMVHFVMPHGEHRPAVVVKVWRVPQAAGPGQTPENGLVNLTVFVDGSNDVRPVPEINISPSNNETLLMRATSVVFSEEPLAFTWHWIEKA